MLAFQYAMISVFPDIIGKDVADGYIYLWFFDLFLTIPIIILLFFPTKSRVIILSSILILSFIIFYDRFRINTIFFNTFLSILITNKFLFFNINETSKTKIAKAKGLRFFLAFGVAFIGTLFDSFLGFVGLYHHTRVGDGVLISPYAKVLIFSGFYAILAFLEYRSIKKAES